MEQKNIPKNGTRKAMHRVEMTRNVLIMMEHNRAFDVLAGSNSSKLLAMGFSNNAYLLTVKDKRQYVKITYISTHNKLKFLL